MADVWKSQGRKFCEICKVWFGDNRASIEFHERGKKHKDALAAKIRELGKKSREEAKARHQMNTALAAMEAAAMKSMREHGEGIPNGPALPATGLASKIFDPRQFKDVNTMAREMAMRKNEMREMKRSAPPPSIPMPAKYFRREPSYRVDYPDLSIPEPKMKVDAAPSCSETFWVEADSGDGSGSKYYFHMYTGESTWERPESFYTWENYQSRFVTSVQTTSKEVEATAGELAANTSKDIVTETKPPTVKNEPQESDDAPLHTGDIPLPVAGESDAGASVTLKAEPVSELATEETQSLVEDQSAPNNAASASRELVQNPTKGDNREREAEKPFGPFGGWTRVEKTDKQTAFSPLTAKYRAEEERQRKEAEAKEKLAEKAEPKVEFTEKTSANLTKKVKGPIEFKKRSATKHVRQRTQ
ncbi:unnamed protein product [Strongylus vulgaris]|uniref:Matrin-type domain-containing protein n=1 Tax=Strongylus vulgaris TaxID=40348 RepID=A0A3P7K7J3_STRVU|nr:unnamed protein product [Strongylus vulgaris]